MTGRGRPRHGAWIGGALALAVAVLVWRGLIRGSPGAVVPEGAAAPQASSVASRPVGDPPRPAPPRSASPPDSEPEHPPPDPAPPDVPHPITPQHAAIFEENAIRERLAGAVARRDLSEARRLLAEHEGANPADPLKVRAGYAVLLDCLERPGDDTRAAARRFYETETASSLRRQIRRWCLEPGAR